jgi:hypothetical protein
MPGEKLGGLGGFIGDLLFHDYVERMIAGVIVYNPPNSPNYNEWISSCLQKTREAMPVIFSHAVKLAA